MTLRIETKLRRGFTVFALSGRIEAEHILELEELLRIQTGCRNSIVDLKEIDLVDRDAVRFLARCEKDGAKLENCPTYIRDWIKREKL